MKPIKIDLNHWQRLDLELLLNGSFAPLRRFMNRKETESVLESYHLPDKTFWPLPIFLDCEKSRGIEEGKPVLLCDGDGSILAKMEVESVWEMGKRELAQRIFQTTDETHPGVSRLFNKTGSFFLSGPVEQRSPPRHYDFLDFRLTPGQFKEELARKKITRLVGFNTRNPMHRAHFELTRRAMEEIEGALLIQPVAGITKPGDIDYVTRMKCYQSILKYYPRSKVFLSLLPLAMRMAGPREALLHGLIRRNYGCTHFIVGRDQVGPGLNAQRHPFYPPYAAQELFQKFEKEIGLKMISFPEMFYSLKKKEYIFCETDSESASKGEVAKISGTEFRRALEAGEEIPEWFSFPEVVSILKESFAPKSKRGLVLFFTGLPGAGKSTIANYLAGIFRERLARNITLLDGDLVRKHLSSGLGFGKEDRDTNIRRIGFVAAEIARHKGLVISAAIAPYAAIREENRRRVEEAGANFVEVYLSTPLAVCESRDPKGHYARARQGLLKNFTGIEDPYEAPEKPEITLDASALPPREAAEKIFDYLILEKYIGSSPN